jgi:hypothetical protein
VVEKSTDFGIMDKRGKEMTYQINLCVGDWSCDGHEKYENYLIDTSLKKGELESAFASGVAILGVNITGLCEEYQDNTIPTETYRKFQVLYPDITKYDYFNEPDDLDEPEVSINPEVLVIMYMETCRVGNPSLSWSFVKTAKTPTINIGGYGLFS